MSGYPNNSTAKVYLDQEGNEVTLRQLVIREPDWAVSRIKVGEQSQLDLEQANKIIRCGSILFPEVEAAKQRLIKTLTEHDEDTDLLTVLNFSAVRIRRNEAELAKANKDIQVLAEALGEAADEVHGASECIKSLGANISESGYEKFAVKYKELANKYKDK